MGMSTTLVMWSKLFEVTSILLSHESATWNLASVGLAIIVENKFENIKSE